jgi:carboxylate-amine ligase
MAEMAATATPPYHLFDVYGVELEYMIVDRSSLNTLPITDQLIRAQCGRIESEIDLGTISWSNELALHVVELKTSTPTPSLAELADDFQEHVQRINAALAQFDGMLLPSAMHPWMDPFAELRLWPHEYSPVYEAFDRVFDCRGHGWANLQSVHLNLPFHGDEEFGRLHAAVRMVLPLLPALAAASPVMDGRATGTLDNRLHVYRTNARKVPFVAGSVIPERAFSRSDYQRLILEPMYREIEPFDPAGLLQDEFLNARGAIARFGRGSIEIRVIDIQECPAADLAVLQLAVEVVRALAEERWSSISQLQAVEISPLYELLLKSIRDADQAVLDDERLLKLFGWNTSSSCTLQQLWQHFAETLQIDLKSDCAAALDVLLHEGPLARRIVSRLAAADDSPESLKSVYRELADCLQSGNMFQGQRTTVT